MIGSHLVDQLIETHDLGVNEPSDIVCLVRNPDTAGHLRDIGVRIVAGDILDKICCLDILKDPEIDYIFHFAAIVDPTLTFNELVGTNVQGTQNVIEAFLESNAHTFCFTFLLVFMKVI